MNWFTEASSASSTPLAEDASASLQRLLEAFFTERIIIGRERFRQTISI